MNHRRFHDELESVTLRPQDSSAEAIDALRCDAELLHHWQRTKELDVLLAKAYLEKSLPADLEGDLLRRLQSSVVAQQTPWKRRLWVASALAACLAMVGIVIQMLDESQADPWERDTLIFFDKLEHAQVHFDFTGNELAVLRAHLIKDGRQLPPVLPESLENLKTLGCTQAILHGQKAVVVCFYLPSGKEAHLAIIDAVMKPSLAGKTRPDLQSDGDWSHATWVLGSKTLMFGTTAGMEELKRALGLC